MHFEQHLQAQRAGEATQLVDFGGREHGGNEQHGIGPGALGFENLVLIHHKILADDGAEIEAAGGGQVLVFAPEKLRVGENGQSGRAGLHVAQRGALHRRVLIYPALGGRLALELGDEAAAALAQ